MHHGPLHSPRDPGTATSRSHRTEDPTWPRTTLNQFCPIPACVRDSKQPNLATHAKRHWRIRTRAWLVRWSDESACVGAGRNIETVTERGLVCFEWICCVGLMASAAAGRVVDTAWTGRRWTHGRESSRASKSWAASRCLGAAVAPIVQLSDQFDARVEHGGDLTPLGRAFR